MGVIMSLIFLAGIALTISTIVYLTYKLTVYALNTYRRNKNNRMIVGNYARILEDSGNKHKMKWDEFEKAKAESVIMEVDNSGKVVQFNGTTRCGVDDTIEDAVIKHDGYIILED